jgi:hypothetical protein
LVAVRRCGERAVTRNEVMPWIGGVLGVVCLLLLCCPLLSAQRVSSLGTTIDVVGGLDKNPQVLGGATSAQILTRSTRRYLSILRVPSLNSARLTPLGGIALPPTPGRLQFPYCLSKPAKTAVVAIEHEPVEFIFLNVGCADDVCPERDHSE